MQSPPQAPNRELAGSPTPAIALADKTPRAGRFCLDLRHLPRSEIRYRARGAPQSPPTRARAQIAVSCATSIRCSQAKQLLSVLAGDFQTVGLADSSPIKPFCGQAHVFKRIVNREQNAVRSNLEHHFRERLRPEIAARRYVKVLAEIMADRALCFGTILQGPGNAIVNAPDTAGKSFAKMPEDDF